MRLTDCAVSVKHTHTLTWLTEFSKALEWLETELSNKKKECIEADRMAKTSKIKSDLVKYTELV